MITIIIRTAIIYIILMVTVRIMGKRQIGELDIFDLLTALLMSEIATMPINDLSIPVSYAVVSIITLVTFEIAASYLMSRFSKFKTLFSARPSTLIKDGKIIEKEMMSSRISTEDLIMQLRQNGITNINEVKYAILEANGRITVIPKEKFKTVTNASLKINVTDQGTDHIIVSGGTLDKYGMDMLGLTKKDIDKILNNEKLKLKEVYLLLVDDSGKYKIFKKEK